MPTSDDAVVEADSTVTASVSAGTGYAVTADAGSGSVVVEDDDTATFTVMAAQARIEEGEGTAVTVAIANGVKFAADEAVTLSASGTAAEGDYALDPTSLTLESGETEVSATLTAVDDEAEEQDETVTVSAAHAGSTVGTATVTITANDAPLSDDATLSGLALSGIDIGTFTPATTAYAATVAETVSSTTVTATPNDTDASVTIADTDGSTAGTSRTTSLALGDTQIAITVTAADGQTTATYTVTVTREYTAPTASIAAATTPVTEGAAAVFTVSLDKPAPEALTVTVTVSETADALAGTASSVALAAGERSATLDLATANDSVVEANSTVTAALAAGDGYSVGAPDSAAVVVEDDDAATFTLTAAQARIEEGEGTALTLAIANGVTFAADQPITLSASGTAVAADYTLEPTTLRLSAGANEVAATLTAVDDEGEEQDETVTVSATHEGSRVGTATVTITANDTPLSDDATLRALTLSGIEIGTFDQATTDYAATLATKWRAPRSRRRRTTPGGRRDHGPARQHGGHSADHPADRGHERDRGGGDSGGRHRDGPLRADGDAAAAESPAWGERLPERDIDLSAADRPRGLWSDGETLWTADWDDGQVVAYVLADGSRATSRDFDLGSYLPTALFADARHYGQRSTQAACTRTGCRTASGWRTTTWTPRRWRRRATTGLRACGRTATRCGWQTTATGTCTRTPWRTVRGRAGKSSRCSGTTWSSCGRSVCGRNGETVLATDWLQGTVRGYALAGGARQSGRDIDEQATGNDYAAGCGRTARRCGWWTSSRSGRTRTPRRGCR